MPNQKVVGYSQDMSATIAPLERACLAGWYCNLQYLKLDRFIDNYFALSAYRAPLWEPVDGSQGGHFKVTAGLIFVKAYDKTMLCLQQWGPAASNSDRQVRAMTIAWNTRNFILKVTWWSKTSIITALLIEKIMTIQIYYFYYFLIGFVDRNRIQFGGKKNLFLICVILIVLKKCIPGITVNFEIIYHFLSSCSKWLSQFSVSLQLPRVLWCEGTPSRNVMRLCLFSSGSCCFQSHIFSWDLSLSIPW